MKLNHSRPEMIAANCATADIWRYLGLPFCSNMANTDNGDFGPQAVFEKTAQYYSVLLSGTNMAYGVGCYEAGMVLRFADLIFSDEVIGYLKKLVCGVEVTDGELEERLANAALELIEKGPQHRLAGDKKAAIDAIMERVLAERG